MIIFAFYAPATTLDPQGSSVCIEYTTGDEPDFLEIDDQIKAMFLGYL
jgi:hypothetical protein